TTRVDPRVMQAMLPYFTEVYGNAGSTSHSFGWQARDAVDEARRQIAEILGAAPREIIFTSGATESNNLAIRGVAERARRKGSHLVSATTEHKAVLDPLARLGRRGYEITLLSVAPQTSAQPATSGASQPSANDSAANRPDAGLLDVQQVIDALRDDTLLVSIMLVNNEIGVIQPVAEIARACRDRGVLVHCDATQAVGKLPLNLAELPVDLLSFSAHKIYGPKGVGALYVRRISPPLKLEPLADGGGQELGLRSGTLNVPGIVGLAASLRLCAEELLPETARLATLRNRLFAGLQTEIPDVFLNGPALERLDWRLAGNLNCSFAYVDGEALMMNLRDIAVSSGSACTSTNPEPSHVLRALGLHDDRCRSSLRFGL
ncbi:MAG TPA: aminotransferase class V-fold PLP-dependent enzyme, partial [Pirellulaceae bacterium]|nr:aminotransferase class V-fold PLP-dependent enzyme [Pirellulaceae bacterium]